MTESRVALLFATSGHSGVDRIVAHLVQEFSGSGHRFDLLTIRNHGPWLQELPDNFRHLPLRAAHRNTVLPALSAYLLRERPSVLLTASHRLNRAALLARTLTRVSTRVVIRMGMSPSGRMREMRPRAARRLQHSMHYWYPRADAVIAPSAGVGADLRRLAGVSERRLHVIPNPVVTDDLAERIAEVPDDPWFAPDETPVILGAGALHPRKDFATLIRAFGTLREQGRDLRLVILGEGRERAALEELAESLGIGQHVRFPGHVSNPWSYMARARLFSLSSRREGSGAVLVEAMACGTPAVATDCPSGPAEILQHGKVGALAPVGDSAALAEAMARTLDAPPDPERLRAAVEPFRASTAARRYLVALGLEKDCAE